MKYFTTKQGLLFYTYSLEAEQKAELDSFLELLDDSGVGEILERCRRKTVSGRPETDPFGLFAAMAYGFAIRASSLRELEARCQYDLRFKYLLDDREPSHMTFSRFFNSTIKPNAREIFGRVAAQLFLRCGLDMADCFLDGTKVMADANRYKKVSKPTRYHDLLDEKVRGLIAEMGLQRGVPKEGRLPSSIVAAKVIEARSASGADARKDYERLFDLLLKKLEYEEQEEICGPNRNSYYKTDHDATAMCLKRDYYSGLGSNMNPAYQVQFTVSHGMVVSFIITQDRTDNYMLIPAMEDFHGLYGRWPRRLGADAGYGNTLNYSYCEEHGILPFIKYQAWEGECSGRRPAVYEIGDDGTLTCLGGRTGFRTEIEGRHHKIKAGVWFRVDGCAGCQFMHYCRRFMDEREGDSKVFEVDLEFQRLKRKARDLLLSPEGIWMRVNRSCQVEGTFGNLKYNMQYERFRRTGIQQVYAEMMMTVLGMNIRKFFKHLHGKVPFSYWSLPEGTEAQSFKKPSAKRIERTLSSKRKKSLNESARDSYKHKKSK